MAHLIKDYDLIIEENENLTIAVVQRGGGGGDKNGISWVVSGIDSHSLCCALFKHLMWLKRQECQLAVATASYHCCWHID